MTNFEMLNAKIEETGISIVKLCDRAGIKRGTFYSRLNGIGEFTASEIEGITKVLKLTRKQRDDIFFCKS